MATKKTAKPPTPPKATLPACVVCGAVEKMIVDFNDSTCHCFNCQFDGAVTLIVEGVVPGGSTQTYRTPSPTVTM